MAITLKIKRGLASDLPALAEGEPGFTLDDKKLYIGHTDGNVQISSDENYTSDEKQKLSGLNTGITTAGDGSAYTATVAGITSLTAGVSFIMVPHVKSKVVAPTLNVNNLGEKAIRRRITGFTSTTVASGGDTGWIASGKPMRVTYDGSYWIADMDKPNVNDLYGTVPITKGGTGATTANDAANNLCEYGTWTPKMQWATNTEKPTVTYQSQIGEYVRIGNIVHAWWKLRFKTSSGWTSSGDYLRISGFPHVFANNNNQGFLSTIVVPGSTLSTSYYVQTYSGYSHVGVQSQSGAALKLTNSNTGDFYFYGQLTYKIDG